MKYVFRFFAGFGILCFILFLVFGLIIKSNLKKQDVKLPNEMILDLKIDPSLKEVTNPDPLRDLFTGKPKNLRTAINTLYQAAEDDRVKMLMIQYTDHGLGFAEIQEFRRALQAFQKTGKKCIAHADTIGETGTGAAPYYMLSPCKTIALQPEGTVGLAGLAMQRPFIREAFDKIGVYPDFVHKGIYKSFPETFERNSYSDPARKMERAILEGIKTTLTTEIAKDRQFNKKAFESVFNNGPYTLPESLNKYNLIDQVGYFHDFKALYATGDLPKAKHVSLFKYAKLQKANETGPKIALIYAEGQIMRGFHEDEHGLFDEDNNIKSYVLAQDIRDAGNNPNIKGIILRVNSPGGSPVASETIRAAIKHVRNYNKKPVIVSMGNVAASGGYWISMSADKIVAEPLTITGSIGVFGGKFVIEEMTEKLGVRFETLSTGGNAGFLSLTEKFNDSQRATFDKLLSHTYDRFITLVKAERALKVSDPKDFAEGRVMTGMEAYRIGLVDALGGIDTAADIIRDRLKADLSIKVYPEPVPALQKLLQMSDENVTIKATMMPLLFESFIYHIMHPFTSQQGQIQAKAYLTSKEMIN